MIIHLRNNMQGRIVKQISNDYTVALDNQEIVTCKARGRRYC